MAVQHAPDGIKIGPDLENNEEDNRLPILDFDEWVVNSDIGVMSANEKRWLTFEGLVTFRAGTTLIVQPINPNLYNQENLLISHAYVSDVGTVKLLVINLSNSSVNFGSDQFNIGGYRTVNS